MSKSYSTIFLTLFAVFAGVLFGRGSSPAPAFANGVQPAVANFAVVPGTEQNGSSVVYFVVTADGKATRVRENGRLVYAPRTNKLDVDIDLPSRMRIDHSGQIRD